MRLSVLLPLGCLLAAATVRADGNILKTTPHPAVVSTCSEGDSEGSCLPSVGLKGENVEQQDPIASCAEGYELSKHSGVCERGVEASVTVVCSEGAVLSKDGARCVREARTSVQRERRSKWTGCEREHACPVRYTATSEGCVWHESIAPLQRNVTHTLECDATPLCPRAFFLNDNGTACEQVLTAAKVHKRVEANKDCGTVQYCPPLYSTREGVRCGREVEGEAEAYSGETEVVCDVVGVCPHGMKVEKDVCVGKHAHKTTLVAYMCPKGCKEGVQTYTPTGASVPTCTRTEESTAYRCPEGQTLKGDVCVRVEYTQPITACPEGCQPNRAWQHGKWQLTCTITARSFEFLCPPDYIEEEHPELDVNGTLVNPEGGFLCVKLNTLPIQWACPVGCRTVAGGLHHDEHGAEDGGEGGGMGGEFACEQDVTGVEDYCPEGYASEGGACVAHHTAPPTYTCPKGCRETKHPDNSGGLVCEREIVWTAVYCPGGWKLSQDKSACVREESESPTYTCPEGMAVAKGRGVCVGTDRQPPVLTCSDGYALVDGMCRKGVPPKDKSKLLLRV